jgi:hypothetical protein
MPGAAALYHRSQTATPKGTNVKQLSRIAAAAAFAAGALVSTSASAAVICQLCNYNANTNSSLYIGALNASNGDLSFVNSGNQANSSGAFTHNYIFNFAPIGSVASNLSFTPSNEISNFKLELFSATASGCSAVSGLGLGTGGCSSWATTGLIATAATGPNNFVDLAFTAVPAGTYLVRVTGTVAAGGPNSGYSGQVTTQAVPEPGSLALAGLALFGAAAAARRARKA